MHRVDLSGGSATGAVFDGADLESIDFIQVDARGASLYGVSLRDAFLADADLRGASLADAKLDGTVMTTDAVMDAGTELIGLTGTLYGPIR